MNKIFYALTIVSFSCVAQSRIYVQGTVGQYAMNSLQAFQTELNNDFNSTGLQTKIVTVFPISLQGEMGVEKIQRGDYALGGFVNYAFTKGRLHYSDYSGATYADQNVSRIVLGGKATKVLNHGFGIYGKVGLNYSMLKLKFTTVINGSGEQSDDVDFYSTGGIIEPGVMWTYPLKRFDLMVQAGYELNIQGKTNLTSNNEAYLLNEAGDKVLINWSGFRIGISLAYNLD